MVGAKWQTRSEVFSENDRMTHCQQERAGVGMTSEGRVSGAELCVRLRVCQVHAVAKFRDDVQVR